MSLRSFPRRHWLARLPCPALCAPNAPSNSETTGGSRRRFRKADGGSPLRFVVSSLLSFCSNPLAPSLERQPPHTTGSGPGLFNHCITSSFFLLLSRQNSDLPTKRPRQHCIVALHLLSLLTTHFILRYILIWPLAHDSDFRASFIFLTSALELYLVGTTLSIGTPGIFDDFRRLLRPPTPYYIDEPTTPVAAMRTATS